MWVPVIAVALAAAPLPKVALVPVVRPALINAQTAARVQALVRAALEKEVAVQPADETTAALEGQDPVRCEGNRACLALIARVSGAWAAVRVEAVEVAGALTVAVQAIDARTSEELAEDHFTVAPAALEETAAKRLVAVAARLKLKVPPPTDAPVAEAPPVLAPKPAPEPPPALVVEKKPHRGPVPVVVTGAGALALAGAAAGFFAMGLDARSCLNGAPIDGTPTVCVPQSQVQAKQAQADAGLVLGSVASALATGLAITAVVLWVTD